MKHYSLFLNGQWVPAASGRTFTTFNPADLREVVAEYAMGGSEDALAAFEAAGGCFSEMGFGNSYCPRADSIESIPIAGGTQGGVGRVADA